MAVGTNKIYRIGQVMGEGADLDTAWFQYAAILLV